MAKNRIIYLFSLIGVIVFYVDYDGWISAYALILVLAVPALSLLLSLPSMVGVRLNVSVKKICERNEKNDIEFSVRQGWFGYSPLFRLRIMIDDLLGDRKAKYEVTAAKGIVSTVPMDTGHCGIFDCTVTKAYVYDFLCLFRLKAKVPGSFSVTVEPTAVRPIPEPDMTGFTARALRPKAGGGFSEIHETREYRPGDPMNSVHWKLSAKTDDIIIREAMIPERLLVIVSVDLKKDRSEYDRTLDRLKWVSGELLNREVPHSVYYLAAEDGALCSVAVTNEDELGRLMTELLSKPLRTDRASLAARTFNEADWRYHIPLSGGDA
jgi:uncharacterized protein (DUF58 family)